MWPHRRRSFVVNASPSSTVAGSCRSGTSYPGGRTSSSTRGSWLRQTLSRTRAGVFLLERFDSFKRRQRDDGRRGGPVTHAQLRRLNRKIDKLLSRLDDTELAKTDTPSDQENECVVCLSAVATMRTFPCSHRVTCRRCFVRTIQTAISDRNLPLRCVVCRARILTLNDPANTALEPATTHHDDFHRPDPVIAGRNKMSHDAPGTPMDQDGRTRSSSVRKMN